jgi:hypothetical protein
MKLNADHFRFCSPGNPGEEHFHFLTRLFPGAENPRGAACPLFWARSPVVPRLRLLRHVSRHYQRFCPLSQLQVLLSQLEPGCVLLNCYGVSWQACFLAPGCPLWRFLALSEASDCASVSPVPAPGLQEIQVYVS